LPAEESPCPVDELAAEHRHHQGSMDSLVAAEFAATSSESTRSPRRRRASCGGFRPRRATPPPSAVRQREHARQHVGVEGRRIAAEIRVPLGSRRVMRRRREWFEPMSEAFLVLWWVPLGHRPSIAEATARLERLRRHGPSPEAFTFRHSFPQPGEAWSAPQALLGDECPAT
jgi:hypothetical protein